MAWFTGTSTGDRYTVGQVYANGNGAFRAEADGTFTNINSGTSLVGSSQDPRVTFGGYAERNSVGLWSADPSFGGSHGPGGAGVGHTAAVRTGGPGNGASSLRVSALAEAGLGPARGVVGEASFAKRGSTLAPLTGSPGPQRGLGETGQTSQYGDIVDQPHKRIGNGGWQTPGTVSDIGWFKTERGWGLTYSPSAKELTEDDLMQQLAWHSRNVLGPALARSPKKPEDLPAEGYVWNFLTQEWVPDERWQREQEVQAEMDDYRANGVMAPMGAPASLNW